VMYNAADLSEVSSGASYEAHKEAAKNDNLSAGSRVGHAVDAVKDKGTFALLLIGSDRWHVGLRIIFSRRKES
jgi:hypothetical protein